MDHIVMAIMAADWNEIIKPGSCYEWCLGFDVHTGKPCGVHSTGDIAVLYQFWVGMFVKVGFVAETSYDKVVTAFRSAFEKHHEVDKISVLSTLVDGLISPVFAQFCSLLNDQHTGWFVEDTVMPCISDLLMTMDKKENHKHWTESVQMAVHHIIDARTKLEHSSLRATGAGVPAHFEDTLALLMRRINTLEQNRPKKRGQGDQAQATPAAKHQKTEPKQTGLNMRFVADFKKLPECGTRCVLFETSQLEGGEYTSYGKQCCFLEKGEPCYVRAMNPKHAKGEKTDKGYRLFHPTENMGKGRGFVEPLAPSTKKDLLNLARKHNIPKTFEPRRK